MNYNEVQLIKSYFHLLVERCLADICVEFESGHTKLNVQEYDKLCLSYRNLLESNQDKYIHRTKYLTESQQQSMIMRMNPALYQQYIKNSESKKIAFVIQLKLDLESIENHILSLEY